MKNNKNYSIKELEKKASEVRSDIVSLFGKVGGGHFGGSLSAVDVTTALYYRILNIDPSKPRWDDRDRFILSKGHAAPMLYSILADLGYFSKELFNKFEDLDNPLTMHPDMHKVPGIDFSTGSMGHGLSIGVGEALSGKIDHKDYKVFVLLGDGETQEGSIWEAAMSASHYKLNNLVGIVDRNMLSVDGFVEEIMSIEPLTKKWESFGWIVKEINGHSMNEIVDVLSRVPFDSSKPSMIIAHTVKGKGISFFENRRQCHRTDISKEQVNIAIEELKRG